MVAMRTKLDARYDQPGKTVFYDSAQLGNILKLRRKELGYTQTDIANFMGCSQRLVSEIYILVNKVPEALNMEARNPHITPILIRPISHPTTKTRGQAQGS